MSRYPNLSEQYHMPILGEGSHFLSPLKAKIGTGEGSHFYLFIKNDRFCFSTNRNVIYTVYSYNNICSCVMTIVKKRLMFL